MRIEPLGDSALLIRIVEDFRLGEAFDAVSRASAALTLAAIPGIIELVPAYATIGVFYDPAAITKRDEASSAFDTLATRIEEALRLPSTSEGAAEKNAPIMEVPVCYDPEFGPDLADVARHAGLSEAEVIRRHAGSSYRVVCVGFTPGFPYLSGLPNELATPRRASPRTDIPAGAVAIGGAQTGIYPRKSPGGWNIIGRTPLRLFDVERNPPALFRAGDQVRFRRISRNEFDESAG